MTLDIFYFPVEPKPFSLHSVSSSNLSTFSKSTSTFFKKKTFGLLYFRFQFLRFVQKDCSKLQKHFLELESITPPLKITGLSNIPERGYNLPENTLF